ncbi:MULTISPECIES: bacteriohemerythrin [unclassified Oceanobacter]|uniref:bacteriohemerythrin n=1 Tax=unclassified Oceanobacter TaxID=2620260 RepID=UPI0026E43172|nr:MULTISPECIES: hemerythrin domain-containing protein [unclassified Oceanobacter]MDO6681698.1 hemerythrin domain-containing protein [Oceanobacter sp. 5_MG-2023]MDP2505674.1 hemerythrin domain-containing protein [Oceanobacter sp. 3_MG-2023]MDP2608287.1 hemerythrin domain-containing protein [Oceanobacter sp. 1_MG-2023]MDP2612172.1 hemerythrin domain-containing protein [Oceanobacter sp. 2_MG-2023]
MTTDPTTPQLMLGHADIDADHQQFTERLAQLKAASGAAFIQQFGQLTDHLAEHFERENSLMMQSGYPASAEHRGEHNRVLGEMTNFRARVEAGRVRFGRAYALEQLPGWFDLHVSTMDAALVEYLKRSPL